MGSQWPVPNAFHHLGYSQDSSQELLHEGAAHVRVPKLARCQVAGEIVGGSEAVEIDLVPAASAGLGHSCHLERIEAQVEGAASCQVVPSSS